MNSRFYALSLFLFFILIHTTNISAANTLSIKGLVTETNSNIPIPYATVFIPELLKGTQTNEKGEFLIPYLSPGFYQLKVSCLGYETYLSHQFRLSTTDYSLHINLEKKDFELKEINITASNFRRNPEAPLSLQIISLKEIEKIPGANRDISKVISSFAGVATSSLGYRNDLFVRGGGPSENKFYLDGVEIPNINHFATQGASGGPVGIINADLLREVDFFSGGFPVNRENGVSSVLDFKMKDGSESKPTYRLTLGASEAGVSANGPIGKKTTYQASFRYSYLQMLFSILKLPFLPQYIDGQFKTKTRFNESNELILLGLGAIDDMKLNDNVDPEEEDRYQLYQVLPEYKQKTYTLGGIYKHYQDRHTQTFVVSNSFLRNGATKYRDNDRGNKDKLRLNYHSDETQTRFRFENSSRIGQFRIIAGLSAEYAVYTNNTLENTMVNNLPETISYHTFLDIWKYGIFSSASFRSQDDKMTISAGIRLDGNNYSDKMNNPLKQIAPRFSFSYNLYGGFYVNANAGRYYQLPLYTAMGYKNNEGYLVNKENIRYFRSDQVAAGLEYRLSDALKVNADLFYKWFADGLQSITDSIPVYSQGSDFGVIGNEAVSSTSKGKAYGLELSGKWRLHQKFNLIASYTFVRSWVIDQRSNEYVPSSWDARNLFTGTFLYSPTKTWDLGLKLRYMGGTPYTPVNTEESSRVVSWDILHEAVLDYSKFNTMRTSSFIQADIRIEKTFFWKSFMLDVYLDIQNVLNSKVKGPADYVSTGVIENPAAPLSEQRYKMKWLDYESGTVLPSIGIIFEF